MTTPVVIMNKYRVLSKKGEGTFSEVLKVEHVTTGVLYAVKCMKTLYSSLKQVNELREIQALRRLNPHPNIIGMEEILYDPDTGRLAIVLELMSCNIYELIRHRKEPLGAEMVCSLMYQLLTAISHMHDQGVFHRDIKPENVLVKEIVGSGDGSTHKLKVADLGSCRGLFSQPPYTEYISTRWYRAPECLLTNGWYDYKMDIWGLGCVFYELLTLHPLFPGNNELDQLDKIHTILGTPSKALLNSFQHRSTHAQQFNFTQKKGTGYAHLLPQSLSTPLLIDLIDKLLIYNPEKRITARQALQHKYFDCFREKENSIIPPPSIISVSANNSSTRNSISNTSRINNKSAKEEHKESSTIGASQPHIHILPVHPIHAKQEVIHVNSNTNSTSFTLTHRGTDTQRKKKNSTSIHKKSNKTHNNSLSRNQAQTEEKTTQQTETTTATTTDTENQHMQIITHTDNTTHQQPDPDYPPDHETVITTPTGQPTEDRQHTYTYKQTERNERMSMTIHIDDKSMISHHTAAVTHSHHGRDPRDPASKQALVHPYEQQQHKAKKKKKRRVKEHSSGSNHTAAQQSINPVHITSSLLPSLGVAFPSAFSPTHEQSLSQSQSQHHPHPHSHLHHVPSIKQKVSSSLPPNIRPLPVASAQDPVQLPISVSSELQHQMGTETPVPNYQHQHTNTQTTHAAYKKHRHNKRKQKEETNAVTDTNTHTHMHTLTQQQQHAILPTASIYLHNTHNESSGSSTSMMMAASKALIGIPDNSSPFLQPVTAIYLGKKPVPSQQQQQQQQQHTNPRRRVPTHIPHTMQIQMQTHNHHQHSHKPSPFLSKLSSSNPNQVQPAAAGLNQHSRGARIPV